MTSIDELIKQLCPSGVETAALGEIGAIFGGLTGKSKADFSGGAARYVAYVNVFNNPAVSVETETFVRVAPGERQRTLQRGDILFTGSSETVDGVGMSSVVTQEVREPLYLNSFCIGYRLNDPTTIDPDFAKHLFRSRELRKQLVRTAHGVTRFNVSKARLAQVKIPLLPLEVQHEIARILDDLNELEAELETALETEAKARRIQQSHYRNEVLGPREPSSPERFAALSDVVDFINGKPHERLVAADGTIALLTARFISTAGNSARWVNPDDALTPARRGDIAMVMSDLPNGRALARCFYVEADGKYTANQRVCLLRVKDPKTTLARYLYHFLDRNPQLLAYDNGQDQTHLKKGQILGVRVPIVPLRDQERAASVLDRLDASTHDLVAGLQIEQEARRVQYAHYRDRLLTFEEAAA